MDLTRAHPETRLPVADLDRAEQWYAEHLGLVPDHRRPGHLIYQLQAGSFCLFASTGNSSGTFTQMSLEVTDICEAVQEMRSRGVAFENYPNYEMTAGIAVIRLVRDAPPVDRAAWLRDLDGNLISLFQLELA